VKIVAIMGSPRGKGSGYKIARKIEDRMKSMGDIEFAYLFLKDANLKPCLGCYQCMATGEEKCPLKDDRGAIMQELLGADGFILMSPVYVSNVSGLMKNFIDRFAYLNHRPRFLRQAVLSAVNMAGTQGKEALSALRYALGGARGSRAVHELSVATPPWLQTERTITKKERAIDSAARKFYQACLGASLSRPTLKSYIDFLMMQRLSIECRQSLPADYEFYKGRGYYFETHVNPIKAIAAKAIVGFMMSIWMKVMGPGNVPWPVEKKETEPPLRGHP
jgi:multimeric flavodoxin WrbA